MWNPDHYFQNLYESHQPELAFVAKNKEQWQEWREKLLSTLTQKLGENPVPASLNPRLLETTEFPDHTRERVEYTIAEHLTVPAYVLIPKNRGGKLPAVVACHGHGFGSKDIIGMNPDGSENVADPGYQKQFALQLVKQGFVVIAPELIGFGDVRLPEDQAKADIKQNSCYRLSSTLLLYGRTMAGLRTFQVTRTLDYLVTREEADSARIGCMGISGGGMVGMLASILDQRIKATVISGYVSSFKDSIMSMHHCLDNYVPGLLQHAEMADIAGLIAPRPLLLESGTQDPIFPIHAVRHAFQRLQSIYSVAGLPGHLMRDEFEGMHEISGREASNWFKRFL